MRAAAAAQYRRHHHRRFYRHGARGRSQEVSDALALALKRDKARTSARKFPSWVSVQMTRKRTRESLEEIVRPSTARDATGGAWSNRCRRSRPKCCAGFIARRSPSAGDTLIVKLNPESRGTCTTTAPRDLETLEQRLGTKIVLRSTTASNSGHLNSPAPRQPPSPISRNDGTLEVVVGCSTAQNCRIANSIN